MVFICVVMGWWAGGLRVPAHGVRELPAAGGLARPPPLPPHPLAEVRAHRGLHQPHRGPEHRYIHYTQITTVPIYIFVVDGIQSSTVNPEEFIPDPGTTLQSS